MENNKLSNSQFNLNEKVKKRIQSSKNYLKLPSLMTKKTKIIEFEPDQFSNQLKRSVQETSNYTIKDIITPMNNISPINKKLKRIVKEASNYTIKDNITPMNNISPINKRFVRKETLSDRKLKKILKKPF